MLNSVNLVGNLVLDVELKKTNEGLDVCNFRLAVNRPNKDKTCDYFTCVAFGNNAAYVSKYGKKGMLCCVTGRLQTRRYENSEGKQVTVTEVIANDVHLVSRQSKDE